MSTKSRVKIFSLTILSVILYSLFIIHPAYAQTASQSSTEVTQAIPATVPATSPMYTDLLINNLFHSFSCLMSGSSVIGQPCLSYKVTKDTQGVIQSIPVLSQANLSGGALGGVTSVLGMLYENQPVRMSTYMASVGENLGMVKVAKAQVVGSGAAVLDPIIKLWQVSRNISYLVMIIVFVIIGLMVMFRQKINPQTVVTAQAAIPGLLVGIVLITFSYFLAAFISDTAFIGTNVVGYYFGAARGDTSKNLLQDLNDNNGNILSIFSSFTGLVDKENTTTALGSVWGYLSEGAKSFLSIVAAFVAAQMTTGPTEAAKAIPEVGAGIQALLIGSAAIFASSNPTASVGVLLYIAGTAALLYAMMKLLFRLVNTFLTIIFLTITAPFQFLAASLPGRQGIATSWILNMLSNALAFPAVLAVFYFVAFILGPTYPNVKFDQKIFEVSYSGITTPGGIIPSALAAPPAPTTLKLVDTNSFPLFGGMQLDFIRLVLAFGALVALPAIPDVINKAIGRIGAAGQMLGQEVSGGINTARGYAGQIQGGVGAAGGFIAGARGLSDTPGYITETTGQVTKVGAGSGKPLADQYQAGYRPGARRRTLGF